MEITHSEYKKLKEIEEENGETGRHGNEPDINTLYSLVHKGYLKNLVSFGIYDWKFKMTQKAEEYLKEEELCIG